MQEKRDTHVTRDRGAWRRKACSAKREEEGMDMKIIAAQHTHNVRGSYTQCRHTNNEGHVQAKGKNKCV